MSKTWPAVRLGEVLKRSAETIEPKADAEYREITVRLWGKGVAERGIMSGAALVTDVNIRKKLYEKYDWLKEIGTGTPNSPTILVFRITSGLFNFWQWENNIRPGPWIQLP